MINLTVQRPPADKRGPDISDPLILTGPVGRERGRNEIDKNCSNRELVSSTGPCDHFVRPGKIVEVADSEQQTWRGMVTACALVINLEGNEFTATTNLRIEREAGR